MGNPRIALPVDDDAGRAYASASPEEKRKIQFLLRLRLCELTTTPTRPLSAMCSTGRLLNALGL
jgi:hypothetical protein